MSEKLYTVIPISQGKELPPRYDLHPMNHAAACNFMDSCRNSFTNYKIHPWPDSVPLNGEPLTSSRYRRDGFKSPGKVYSFQSNIGKAKHVVNFHDGESMHPSGCPFWGIAIFSSLRKRDAYVKSLQAQGYRYL